MSNDSWRTPDDLFNVLDKGGIYQGIEFQGFNFDIDLCATEDNSKCNNFFVDYLEDRLHLNYLSSSLANMKVENYLNNKTCFMNPPYSNPLPFIEKAWDDSRYCRIVCLVKVDTSTKWWATFWEYKGHVVCPSPTCNKSGAEYHIEADLFSCNCGANSLTYPYNKWLSYIKGPKPGCDVIYFPKRIKFDPPQELVDSVDVWKIGNKWVQKCKNCCGLELKQLVGDYPYGPGARPKWVPYNCGKCKGKGYIELSGPSFASCLIVMDRRGL